MGAPLSNSRIAAMAALIVIDVQNDFLDDGPFKLKGAHDAVIGPINRLLDLKWDLIVATRDWHPHDHTSFASTRNVDVYTPITLEGPNGETKQVPAWPDHCVQNTHGAQLSSDLDTDKIGEIVNKGTNKLVECFSAFRDVFHTTDTGLKTLLDDHGIRTVYVAGLVTEFCVLETAVDAKLLGFETYIIKDAVFAINGDGKARADAKCKELDIPFVSSNDVKKALSTKDS